MVPKQVMSLDRHLGSLSLCEKCKMFDIVCALALPMCSLFLDYTFATVEENIDFFWISFLKCVYVCEVQNLFPRDLSLSRYSC